MFKVFKNHVQIIKGKYANDLKREVSIDKQKQ